MKVLPGISLFGAVTALFTAVGCGSSTPANQSYSYGSSATGSSTSSNTSSGVPIYSGSQLVGYKSRIALFTGNQPNIAVSNFFEQISVQAGDRLIINPQVATYTIQQGFCNGVLANVSSVPSRAIANFQVSLNGQVAVTGMTVPAAGMLAIQGVLNTAGIACAWGQMTNVEYNVSLSDFYSTTPAVAVDRCTSTNGVTFACPF